MKILKCELCDKEWFFNQSHPFEDEYDNIAESGRCLDCQEEWGFEYPDRY